MPEHLSKIIEISSNLASNLNDFGKTSETSKQKIITLANSAIEELKSITKKLDKADSKEFLVFVKKSKKLMCSPSEDDFWSIYQELKKAENKLQNIISDRQKTLK